MVADLVRNHVGLRKLAGFAADIASTKPSLKILKETCPCVADSGALGIVLPQQLRQLGDIRRNPPCLIAR
jgi:hypothetical protein